MAYGRRVRRRGVPAALVAMLLAGAAACDSGSEPGKKATASRSATAGGDTAPTRAPRPEADPEKVPRTAAQARRLVQDVLAEPEHFGPGTVKATPYESDPARWTVLAEDCAWRTEGLPEDVLATRTRYFEIPAAGGKGAMEVSATVTVHRTTLDAAWEQARMLEEAVGCPEQTLRAGERLTGLTSLALAYGEGANETSDDALSERGECVSDSRGRPYPYTWDQSTFGPVVVGVSVCAGEKTVAGDVATMSVKPLVMMMQRAQDAIAREDPGDAGDAGDGSPGTKEGD
ncbi:hypothetical protein [Streptomyces sp. WAC 06738]|uniref:hypothetical protein n=1 Tax=Streptomyces sp. WAC 06738 TaxID=2203210 RepID=UPI001F0C5881|nr:hypothetical protein [Streptomyces sp. WAC 06738]